MYPFDKLRMYKMAQALAQGYLWREAEVALKGCGICIGGGHIAWLHGDKLLVGLEVKVLWQHAGTDKLLLKDSNKVEQVLGLTATNVIFRKGRAGGSF